MQKARDSRALALSPEWVWDQVNSEDKMIRAMEMENGFQGPQVSKKAIWVSSCVQRRVFKHIKSYDRSWDLESSVQGD